MPRKMPLNRAQPAGAVSWLRSRIGFLSSALYAVRASAPCVETFHFGHFPIGPDVQQPPFAPAPSTSSSDDRQQPRCLEMSSHYFLKFGGTMVWGRGNYRRSPQKPYPLPHASKRPLLGTCTSAARAMPPVGQSVVA